MALDKFTLLRNKFKRVVEQNTDGRLDEKEDALRDEIIEELQNNPRGIVISTQQIIRFSTANINEWDWFFELLLDDENESSVSELLKEDYVDNDPLYYEQEGLEVKYDVTITDLEGNELC